MKYFQSNAEAQNILHEFSNPSVLDHTAYILIAIGGFVFIISFLGYCGSLQESRLMLTAYGLFLIIIFALQVGAKETVQFSLGCITHLVRSQSYLCRTKCSKLLSFLNTSSGTFIDPPVISGGLNS